MQLKGHLTQLPSNIRSPSVSIRGKCSRAFQAEDHWRGTANGRHRTRLDTDENPSHGEFLGPYLIPRIT